MLVILFLPFNLILGLLQKICAVSALKLIELWCSLSEKETGFKAVQPKLLAPWSSGGVLRCWECWIFWCLWLLSSLFVLVFDLKCPGELWFQMSCLDSGGPSHLKGFNHFQGFSLSGFNFFWFREASGLLNNASFLLWIRHSIRMSKQVVVRLEGKH